MTAQTVRNFLWPARYEIKYMTEERAFLGDSPFWSTRYNAFFWTDMYGQSINMLDWDTQKIKKIYLTPLADGIPANVKSMGENFDGTIIAAFDKGFGRITLRDMDSAPWGETETITNSPTDGKPSTTFMNDGKVSPDGRFFAGQIFVDGLMPPPDSVWSQYGTMNPGLLQSQVYTLNYDGSVSGPLDDIGYHFISNGQTWSPDGESYYFTDTVTNTMKKFDYDQTTGQISNGYDFFTNPGAGQLDGATTDASGNIWHAALEGGVIYEVDGQTGEILDQIDLNRMSITTSVAWGGDDYDTLLLTTGSYGLDPVQRNGGIALIKFNDGTRGMPANLAAVTY